LAIFVGANWTLRDSYATIAVAMLIVTLLFFATPSRAEQYSCLVISFLLFVDAIIILAVEGIRVEAGWVGITSVIWAMTMSGWVVCYLVP